MERKFLGLKAKDKVSGYTGIITGVVEYLTGNKSFELTQSVAPGGEYKEGVWFDVNRIEIIEEEN